MVRTIKINGFDYTSYFTPSGAKVFYKKIRGRNSGGMQDGSSIDDVIATKAVITATCMPLNDAQVAKFLSDITQTYVNVYFFDPRLNAYRTALFTTSEPEFKDNDCTENSNYWTGAVVTFTENREAV